MPRLNPIFRSAVAFLYGRHPQSGDIVGPLGTAALVATPRQDQEPQAELRHAYAVTNHHVIFITGATILRVNTKDGESRYIETDPHEWQFIAGGDDIAATDITDITKLTDEVAFVPQDLFVTKEFISGAELGIGDDGFMLGLFAAQAGDRRNMVAARFGNVSLLADDDALVEQPNGVLRPSHIFDMRSRPGFSGSPVFIYRTPGGDLREIHKGPKPPKTSILTSAYNVSTLNALTAGSDEWGLYLEARGNTFLRLLGIHAGQYPEKVEVHKLRKQHAESDDLIRDRDKLEIPSSMTVVVPAWEITNLLNLKKFEDQRRQRELRDEVLMGKGPRPERAKPKAEVADAPAPAATSDKNARHREDFRRLVSAASKSKPKGGRT